MQVVHVSRDQVIKLTLAEDVIESRKKVIGTFNFKVANKAGNFRLSSFDSLVCGTDSTIYCTVGYV